MLCAVYDLLIDNYDWRVFLFIITAAFPPTNLVVAAKVVNELEATWSPPVVESLTIDHYEVGIADQAPTPVTESSKTFTNLTTNLEYSINVKACYTPTDSTSPWCSTELTTKATTLPGSEYFVIHLLYFPSKLIHYPHLVDWMTYISFFFVVAKFWKIKIGFFYGRTINNWCWIISRTFQPCIAFKFN